VEIPPRGGDGKSKGSGRGKTEVESKWRKHVQNTLVQRLQPARKKTRKKGLIKSTTATLAKRKNLKSATTADTLTVGGGGAVPGGVATAVSTAMLLL